ncbi:hypothetical protein B0A52_03296 [Exophiala mesophila]|uniref:Uncharacterized protein n=1 Tax=Exophiala mesophila TaxID=212818 RepID=A0A438NB05_EXOME|nr:hypothetical protein B0A52_03296 [Exophiala mesophila]
MSSADPRLNRRGQTQQAISKSQPSTAHPPQPLTVAPSPDVVLSPNPITDFLVTLINKTVDECFARKRRDFLLEQSKISSAELDRAQKKYGSHFPLTMEQAEEKSREAENARDCAENTYRDHVKIQEAAVQDLRNIIHTSINAIQYANRARQEEDSNTLSHQVQELRQKHETLEMENKRLRDFSNQQETQVKALEMEVKSLQASQRTTPVPTPDPDLLTKIAHIEDTLERLGQNISQWENVKKALNLKMTNLEEWSKTSDAAISQTKESLRSLATKDDLQTQDKKIALFEAFQSITIARLEKVETPEPVAPASDPESRALEIEMVKSELTEKCESLLLRHREQVEGQLSKMIQRQDRQDKSVSFADARSRELAEIVSSLSQTSLDDRRKLSDAQAHISALMNKRQSDTTFKERVTEQEKEIKRLVQQLQKVDTDLNKKLSSWWAEFTKTVPKIESFEAMQARVLSLESSMEQLSAIQRQLAKMEHNLQEFGNSRAASTTVLASHASIPDPRTRQQLIDETIQSASGQASAENPTDQFSSRLDSLKVALANQKEQLDQVDRVASAAVRAGLSNEDRRTLESTKGIDQRMEKLEHVQQSLAIRFDNLTTESLMRRMVGYLQPVLPKFELGLKEMDTIAGQFKSLEQNFVDIKDSHHESNTRYDVVAEQCKAIRSGLEEVQQKVERIENGQLEKDEKLDQLDKAMGEQELAVKKAHDDLAQRFSETRDEVVGNLRGLTKGQEAQRSAVSSLEATVKALSVSAKAPTKNGTARSSQSISSPSQPSSRRSTPLSNSSNNWPRKSKIKPPRKAARRRIVLSSDESESDSDSETHEEEQEIDDDEADDAENYWDDDHIGRMIQRRSPLRVPQKIHPMPDTELRKTLASGSSDKWISTKIPGPKRKRPETAVQEDSRSPARRRRK